MSDSANKATLSGLSPQSSSLTDKLRWSIRLRLRKQLELLSVEFFDEVDDFLFSNSKQAQSSGDNPYLKSMRELRTKQTLFEENFLDQLLFLVERSQCNIDEKVQESSAASDHSGATFEKVEIDLAIRSMQRKANKYYAEHYEQINAINKRSSNGSAEQIISSQILVTATLDSFLKSQETFLLELEIRLVFIKLFEQHFLLSLDKVFSDLISILNNASDPAFVEKLIASSSAFQASVNTQINPSALDERRVKIAAKGSAVAQSIEAGIDDFVSELCDSHRMPLFIEKMIRTQWREVMFLIGLNSGPDSIEFNEAKHSVLLLSAAAGENSQVSAKEKELILAQIEQGFQLIQLSADVRDSFTVELSQLFGSGKTLFESESSSEKTKISNGAGASTLRKINEASISPAGKRVLDKDDLTELANMLGAESPSAPNTTSNGSDLDEYLSEVDLIVEGQHGNYKFSGQYINCHVMKSSEDFFEIQLEGDKPSITRSRLGLALAIKQGLLKFNKARITRSISSVTVLDHHIH